MAVYPNTVVSTERELITALDTKKICIIIENEEFYWEIREKAQKVKKAKDSKTIGKIGIALGVGLAFFTGGISWLAAGLFCGSSIFTALSNKKDSFKDYNIFLDYDNHQIVLIRSSFDKNKDKITGFDVDTLSRIE